MEKNLRVLGLAPAHHRLGGGVVLFQFYFIVAKIVAFWIKISLF